MGTFVLEPHLGAIEPHSHLKIINFQFGVTYKDMYSKGGSTTTHSSVEVIRTLHWGTQNSTDPRLGPHQGDHQNP